MGGKNISFYDGQLLARPALNLLAGAAVTPAQATITAPLKCSNYHNHTGNTNGSGNTVSMDSTTCSTYGCVNTALGIHLPDSVEIRLGRHQ